MASYCPECKGLMRPRRGVLECIRCSQAARARTVVARGRRISLGEGQAALTDRRMEVRRTTAFEPPLQPRKSTWRPPGRAGGPHPQLGLFPHDRIRDGQRRLARDVKLAVGRGGHLVAQAPTGIGKTAAALAPALEDALAHGRTVLFLTSRQSQHRIAVETLRAMREKRGAPFTLVDLVSKRDMCLRSEAQELHPGRFPDFCASETRTRSCPYLGEVDADTLERVRDGVLHVEELMQASKEAMLCPHLVAMEAAKRAHVVVADYNHLFSDLRERSLERLGLRLADAVVVVDEAHNLPDRIRQSHSHRITAHLLDRVAEEARGERMGDVVADVEALRTALRALTAAAERDGTAQEARFGDSAATRVARLGIEALGTAFEQARSHGTLGLHRTLQDAAKDLTTLVPKVRRGTDAPVQSEALLKALEDWGRFRDGALRFLQWEAPETVELHVRLLDPAVPARPVFQQVHAAILMSGTLEPPGMARDVLGLEEGRTTVRSYDSPFPPRNRMVVVARGVSTRYRDRGEETWNRYAGMVQDLCAAAKGNVALFAPSYAILRELKISLENVGGAGREVVEEEPGMTKGERDQVLDALKGAQKRGGALLMGVLGGSFSEGVDYRDNLLSAVAVAGLPLAPPDLETEATIAHFEKRLPRRGRLYGYVYPAMNKVLQAMGRGIRSEHDRCAVLLLDERYLQMPYRGVLPRDPAPVASDAPVATVRAFLEGHGL